MNGSRADAGSALEEQDPSALMSLAAPAQQSAKPKSRALLKIANAVLGTIARTPVLNLELNLASILDKAFSRTGLHRHFDESLYMPMKLLIDSFNRDADLNPLGSICVKFDVLRMLCNNLMIAQTRKDHPEIAREEVRSPVFITGLPRSGTTLLHSLMAHDDAVRVPRVWELMYPCPPPETTGYDSDPRVARTEHDLKWLDLLIPDFKRVHLIGATLPQECIVITGHAFRSQVFESMYYVNSYRSWHEREDSLPGYEYHAKFLQHLQWKCPGQRWVLKAPSHLFGLESIVKVYPDAKIVFTHRDPLKVIPSCASFTEILRSPFTNIKIDRSELGREISRHWQKGARRAIEFRRNSPGSQHNCLDIHYNDLVENPVGTVQGLYEYFGWELTGATRRRMQHFLAQNPIHHHGRHEYSLPEYGLTAGGTKKDFTDYIDCFGVRSEGP